MEHRVFKPATFEEGRHSVIGFCNGIHMEERWEKETPSFARAIFERLPPGARTVLDYGCGVGRISRELLSLSQDIEILGVDASADELRLAKIYVNNPRFKPMYPKQLDQKVDLAFCVYVFQHIPAIEIREALARIHYFLKPSGIFCYCSSTYRMAVRFDTPSFHDDRNLGVDLMGEVERFFTPIGPLFTEKMLQENELVRRMVRGESRDPKIAGLPHPALVYYPKKIEGPYFNQ